MSRSKQEPEKSLDWPEPLVIEIICERYQDVADGAARTAIARLQDKGLRELVAGRSRQAASLRLALIGACAGRGISAERIARADLAVFLELTRVAAARFRTSPRRRAEVCARLDASLDQLQAAARPAAAASRVAGAAPRMLRPAVAIG